MTHRGMPDATIWRNEPVMSDSLTAPSLINTADAATLTIDNPVPEAGPLSCQWCSVPLADGITICPTCGSPGIADPEMTVVGLTVFEEDEILVDPLKQALAEQSVAGGEDALV